MPSGCSSVVIAMARSVRRYKSGFSAKRKRHSRGIGMSGATRVLLGFALLAVTWIVVYWITPAQQQRAWESSALAAVTSAPGERRSPGLSLDDGEPEALGRQPTNVSTSQELIDPLLQRGITELDSSNLESQVQSDAQGSTDDAQLQVDERVDPVITPPSFTVHTVEEGENAWSLSERFFGDREWAGAIMRMNPEQDFYRLRVGNLIKIPVDPRNVQGVTATGAELPQGEAVDETTYAVRRGDTLGQIAARVYGTSRLWTLIRDANPDINEQGTNIKPGQVLLMPLPPAQP